MIARLVPTAADQYGAAWRQRRHAKLGTLVPCAAKGCPRSFAPDDSGVLRCGDKAFCSATCRERSRR